MKQVDEFAGQGLRTLVFGMRVLEHDDEVYVSAKMTDAEVERDFTLIGVSGLADKLQEDVKQCISEFIDAGIKVWIVTGDKDSTARSIGYQTGILNEDRELLELGARGEDSSVTNKAKLID